jgi:ABC-2 type transport system permease protein
VLGLGFAFGRGDAGSYRIAATLDDSTAEGSALLAGLRAVPIFQVDTPAAGDARARLEDGTYFAAVSLGERSTSAPAPVVVAYDPARSTAAQVVLPVIRQVVGQVDLQLSGRQPALTVEPRSVRSQNLRFVDFVIPGIIAFSILQAGLFAALPLAQLRLQRVLKRFGATPVSRWTILASQGTVRVLLMIVQTLVLIGVGWLAFGFHISQNWLGVLAFLLLGGAAFLGLGFAISGLARTEEGVPALVQLVSFPMMFISGVFFPVEAFPEAIQVLARLMPLTFLADGLRQVMVGGSGLNALWVDVVVMALWAVAGALLAARLFKWE